MDEKVESTSSSNYKFTRPIDFKEEGREVEGSVLVYPFGPYEVFICLSNSGEFIKIIEIRLNKDFRNYKQKIESRGHHDVNDIYENE